MPSWLSSLLESNDPAPKLYAWTPAHLGLSTSTQSSSSSTLSTRQADDANRRLYILGLGNLGRMYAMYIRTRANPPPVTLIVHRKELLAQWNESNGIEITYKGEVQTCKDFDIEWWTEEKPPPEAAAPAREAADGGKLRNLLVTTKAQVALPEVDRMRRYLDAESTVAFAQNGMSKLWPPHGAAYMAARFPRPGDGFNAVLCVTNHGLYSTGAFSSVFASPADAYLGPVLLQQQRQDSSAGASPPPSVAYLTEQITSAAILEAGAFSSLDVWVLQLEKLVINTCINPLTAILRCKTGGLFLTPDGVPAQVMDRMLDATSRILRALVADPGCEPILATDARGRAIPSIRAELDARFARARLRDMLHRGGLRVKDNKSSMLQDVEAGKPTTEIRDFNGWLVDMAAYLGDGGAASGSGSGSIDVSVHEKVIDLVERRVVMNEEQLAAHFLKD
ncbi:hypothetical protein PWT90_05002 [Aphanocladium album]|nr:hypothetical protein PWT90_05002 [Aphanocladium album]